MDKSLDEVRPFSWSCVVLCLTENFTDHLFEAQSRSPWRRSSLFSSSSNPREASCNPSSACSCYCHTRYRYCQSCRPRVWENYCLESSWRREWSSSPGLFFFLFFLFFFFFPVILFPPSLGIVQPDSWTPQGNHPSLRRERPFKRYCHSYLPKERRWNQGFSTIQ